NKSFAAFLSALQLLLLVFFSASLRSDVSDRGLFANILLGATRVRRFPDGLSGGASLTSLYPTHRDKHWADEKIQRVTSMLTEATDGTPINPAQR
ncbi:hypothetical protein, partial [Halorubrum sp. Atlit-26R]|uniref:hypothetical protein n=1 Tax=Halorubrum sp. Atlit-26R TaxID=2282128 RepID=UPI001F1590D9